MSVEAITWALRQPVKQSGAKFVLVVLANCASGETFLAYPSSAYLAAATSQDRKSVLANLAKLREWGLIEDTGKRTGATKQIPVWKVLCQQPDLFVAAEEGTQKRDGSESGTVPVFPGKGPVFPQKGSRKRDTEASGTAPKQSKPPKPAALMPDCPSWVKPEAWQGFVDMRKKRRSPMTPRAAELVILELEKLKAAGADPNQVLDQSTRNGWLDVFPIREPLPSTISYGARTYGQRPEPPAQHHPDAREVVDRARAKKPASPEAAKAALSDLGQHFSR